MRTAGIPFIMLGVVVFAGAALAQAPAPEVVLENASVRVTVRTFPPGTGSGRHEGIEPEIGIVADGDVTVERPEGSSVVRNGGAFWVPGLTPHDARNEGAGPARLYEVFLKRCD
jgi:mannose-6-phosphate isomerase-like protein (cupin superfamily)